MKQLNNRLFLFRADHWKVTSPTAWYMFIFEGVKLYHAWLMFVVAFKRGNEVFSTPAKAATGSLHLAVVTRQFSGACRMAVFTAGAFCFAFKACKNVSFTSKQVLSFRFFFKFKCKRSRFIAVLYVAITVWPASYDAVISMVEFRECLDRFSLLPASTESFISASSNSVGAFLSKNNHEINRIFNDYFIKGPIGFSPWPFSGFVKYVD